MENGTISGNTVTEWSGGGVNANTDGAFIMKGGVIRGNRVAVYSGGGVNVNTNAAFTMEGGTIYGNAASLPAGTDASHANNAPRGASLAVKGMAQWGTAGAYTKGGASETSGSNIGTTNDTLIAAPEK